MCFCFDVIEKKSYDDTVWLAVPWILWGLWKHRNGVVFEGKHGDRNKLIDSALEEADLWKKEQDKVKLEDRRDKQDRKILEKKRFKPSTGHLKCNVHAVWVNSTFMCGGAWIIRDSIGSVLFHARDAFTPVTNRLTAELWCIEWTVNSVMDLRLDYVEVWSDFGSAIDAINNPRKWPRYQGLLSKIQNLCGAFQVIKF
ncbi:hypothetical protein V5N11_001535 [Cardamine amara subsp. amara]|uniref:RNase H type-1 domain-containing protein n=1 Tax=Cardamine amara subsp. amara TaxID=228776 RepID=A0ABD0ZAP2_CARAN